MDGVAAHGDRGIHRPSAYTCGLHISYVQAKTTPKAICVQTSGSSALHQWQKTSVLSDHGPEYKQELPSLQYTSFVNFKVTDRLAPANNPVNHQNSAHPTARDAQHQDLHICDAPEGKALQGQVFEGFADSDLQGGRLHEGRRIPPQNHLVHQRGDNLGVTAHRPGDTRSPKPPWCLWQSWLPSLAGSVLRAPVRKDRRRPSLPERSMMLPLFHTCVHYHCPTDLQSQNFLHIAPPDSHMALSGGPLVANCKQQSGGVYAKTECTACCVQNQSAEIRPGSLAQADGPSGDQLSSRVTTNRAMLVALAAGDSDHRKCSASVSG
ncbi:hypothetical protein Anapl_08179 [Anas platyrhynchos]|uniref:Uncharacterized protein n=1 Tax=Anas platyrhynchos TaxID=8839 RepID=R0LFM1_ANAPL|nr:hypothetical protein Anapl_08179 [Anas platyrhynchos]